jgi:hypothetical protein
MSPAADAVEEMEASPDGGANVPAPSEAILRLRHEIASGRHWFDALLSAIGDWRAPEETVAGRRFRYLVGGEAFDWMLLAERLLEAVRDLVPAAEADALLFQGAWPIELDDSEFADRLGPAKFSSHLNYLYGVMVEEALQLAVEEEIHKQSYSRVWGQDPRDDEGMWRRVYGCGLQELLALYYEGTGILIRDRVDHRDLKDFTYWLFRLRLKRQDKARVASDTRKGLAQLTRMELAVSQRRHGATLGEADFVSRFVDVTPAR